ncbi:multidrug transporter subunit MdtN (plasmid) [Photobacterium sp. GJ3]|uniref:multidrug transporter subunit MdtN n=1 Tax=Photobacterium sp. GJ3 TaxID=2829502 RepID=UPI001B8A901A|nr:multidrug transporter subunit MdtN [Photobacterium sp. GJ3]QUJ70448.1 multidrug transporter subunit MdtN [Photobacterium sp. GJ3]
MSLLRKIYALVLLGLTVFVLGLVLDRVDSAPRTDDAYAWADTIDVVPEVSGRIIELPVQDNQLVRKGDLLYRVDPRPYENALAAAQAKLATLDEQIRLQQRSVDAQKFNAEAVSAQEKSAKARYIQAADSYQRKLSLVKKGYVSRDDLEQALSAKNSAEAIYKAARLQTRQANSAITDVKALVAQKAEVKVQIVTAKLNLEYSEVYAPFDGRIASLRTTVGQYASPAQSVMTLIDTSQWYVIAHFRETDLKGVHNGTPARVYLTADTSKHYTGVVESMSYGVAPKDGGRIVNGLPSVERSINWVHVSQRFPVKIAIQDPDPWLFRIGASAIATVQRDIKAEDK